MRTFFFVTLRQLGLLYALSIRTHSGARRRATLKKNTRMTRIWAKTGRMVFFFLLCFTRRKRKQGKGKSARGSAMNDHQAG